MKEIKYGLWTVTDGKAKRIGRGVYYLCRCECGTNRNVIIKNLKSGISKSCGCVGKGKLNKRNFKHGKSFSGAWRSWRGMKNRCYNKNFAYYKRYGGRGIKVCKEWVDDFMAFYRCVGDRPRGKTLERIDNNRGYKPDNVKWASPHEQTRNRVTNRKINGVCITDISRKLGGNHTLVGKRLRRGWSVERAINAKSNAGL